MKEDMQALSRDERRKEQHEAPMRIVDSDTTMEPSSHVLLQP